MADHDTPGDKLSARLMARQNLSRVSMGDGGEVYTGPTARRALRAVGARAMTMDETIIVDQDFDPSNPEDQSLYAHERVHQLESGGTDMPNQMLDAEEKSAIAVEQMVLHRSASGESFGEIMRDVVDPVSRAGRTRSLSPQNQRQPGSASSSQGAYAAMAAQGMSHEAIVEMLARKVIDALVEREETTSVRSTAVRSI